MGCRCCKMIQSYLFDPVQVSSPGYVNEVSSCKLDEEDTVKLKGKQSSEVLVHRNDLQREGLGSTESRSRVAGPQEPSRPPQGPHPHGDTGGGHCAEKPSGALNGIGPAAAPQPTGGPGAPQGGAGSWASTSDSVHPTQPFLDGGDRGLGCAAPASEESRGVRDGDSAVPAKAESPAQDVQDHVLHIPAPDYPQRWGVAGDNGDHGEKDRLVQSPGDEAAPEDTHPRAGEQSVSAPFSLKRSWDSFNEAVAGEVLSVSFKEESPSQAVPEADSRNGWEDAHGCPWDRRGEDEDEDAAVAEALAALEAATAGEDVDEAD